jgi:hypothetical protein
LGLLHLVGGLVELLGQLLHLRIAALAGKTFQLARGLASFLDHLLLLSLITAGAAALHLLPATLFFECRLLAAREFFQTSFGFTLLLFSLLLLSTLHGLVLVLHLVQFEIEETGELLLFALTATATTAVALIAESDLHFAEDRVRGEQPLQRALFGRQSIFSRLFSQRRRCAFHLFGGLTQVLGHFRDLLLSVGAAESTAHAIEKLERVSS